jgi:hypothetical protein
VAGCLWEDRNPSDIREVVEEPAGKETRWRSETTDGREMSFLTVEGAIASEDVDEVSGPGYFCYFPE